MDYYLLNTTVLGTTIFPAGSLIVGVADPLPDLQASGGILVPTASASPALLQAIARAQQARTKGQSFQSLDAIVLGAFFSDSISTLEGTAGGFSIYQPGGTRSGNTYLTLGDAVSAVQDRGGGQVRIDGNFGSPVAPALPGGAAYNFANVDLCLTNWKGGGFILDLEDGCTFEGLERVFGGLALRKLGASPVFTVSSGSREIYFGENVVLTTDDASTGPLFLVETGTTLYLWLGYGCVFVGSLGYPIWEIEAGGTGVLEVGTKAVVDANTLKVAGTLTSEAGITAGQRWGSINATQVVTGTWNDLP